MKGTVITNNIGGSTVTKACASLFAWKNGVGLAEASTLALVPGAAPDCIEVTSHKTGTKRFYFRTSTLPELLIFTDRNRNELHIFND